MPSEKHSHDAIYVEYGKFRAGARGPIAVPFFIALVAASGLTKLLGLW